jgi:hypothetical protein
MGGFFTALLAKFGQLASWFINLFKAVFTSAWLILQDICTWVFIESLKLVALVLNALPGADAFGALNPGQYMSSLSAETVQILGLIRIGEAFAIILAAIAIKLALQVIPFTRLGS